MCSAEWWLCLAQMAISIADASPVFSPALALSKDCSFCWSRKLQTNFPSLWIDGTFYDRHFSLPRRYQHSDEQPSPLFCWNYREVCLWKDEVLTFSSLNCQCNVCQIHLSTAGSTFKGAALKCQFDFCRQQKQIWQSRILSPLECHSFPFLFVTVTFCNCMGSFFSN